MHIKQIVKNIFIKNILKGNTLMYHFFNQIDNFFIINFIYIIESMVSFTFCLIEGKQEKGKKNFCLIKIKFFQIFFFIK